ncbi:hypothetical protein ACVWW1_006803 [Bradyrhizobium sp. JR3.5]
MSAADILPFVRAWVRNPLRVAAVAPSGPAVSSLMAQEITADTGPVLELGPGTGVFTRALLKRGVRQQDLTLVEYGSEFIPLLQRRFPGARVLWMDAAWLRRESLFDGAPGRCGRERPRASHDAAGESHNHPPRRLRLSPRRRGVLPDHLWSALPCRRRDPGSPRSAGELHRADVPQPASGIRVPDQPPPLPRLIEALWTRRARSRCFCTSAWWVSAASPSPRSSFRCCRPTCC